MMVFYYNSSTSKLVYTGNRHPACATETLTHSCETSYIYKTQFDDLKY